MTLPDIDHPVPSLWRLVGRWLALQRWALLLIAATYVGMIVGLLLAPFVGSAVVLGWILWR